MYNKGINAIPKSVAKEVCHTEQPLMRTAGRALTRLQPRRPRRTPTSPSSRSGPRSARRSPRVSPARPSSAQGPEGAAPLALTSALAGKTGLSDKQVKLYKEAEQSVERGTPPLLPPPPTPPHPRSDEAPPLAGGCG